MLFCKKNVTPLIEERKPAPLLPAPSFAPLVFTEEETIVENIPLAIPIPAAPRFDEEELEFAFGQRKRELDQDYIDYAERLEASKAELDAQLLQVTQALNAAQAQLQMQEDRTRASLEEAAYLAEQAAHQTKFAEAQREAYERAAKEAEEKFKRSQGSYGSQLEAGSMKLLALEASIADLDQRQREAQEQAARAEAALNQAQQQLVVYQQNSELAKQQQYEEDAKFAEYKRAAAEYAREMEAKAAEAERIRQRNEAAAQQAEQRRQQAEQAAFAAEQKAQNALILAQQETSQALVVRSRFEEELNNRRANDEASAAAAKREQDAKAAALAAEAERLRQETAEAARVKAEAEAAKAEAERAKREAEAKAEQIKRDAAAKAEESRRKHEEAKKAREGTRQTSSNYGFGKRAPSAGNKYSSYNFDDDNDEFMKSRAQPAKRKAETDSSEGPSLKKRKADIEASLEDTKRKLGILKSKPAKLQERLKDQILDLELAEKRDEKLLMDLDE